MTQLSKETILEMVQKRVKKFRGDDSITVKIEEDRIVVRGNYYSQLSGGSVSKDTTLLNYGCDEHSLWRSHTGTLEICGLTKFSHLMRAALDDKSCAFFAQDKYYVNELKELI